jgi:hypothetical protein
MRRKIGSIPQGGSLGHAWSIVHDALMDVGIGAKGIAQKRRTVMVEGTLVEMTVTVRRASPPQSLPD